jgi:hypothetical protein
LYSYLQIGSCANGLPEIPAMMMKLAPARPIPSFLLPFTQSIRARSLHHRVKAPRAPQPTPFVPDVQTSLSLIGRNLSQHAPKIPSWNALFSLTSTQLRELGVEPPRARRYLLSWREKFRQGRFGIGGELRHVENGEARLSVVEVPANGHRPATATLSSGKRKIVINSTSSGRDQPLEELKPVAGVKIKGAHTIVGPHVLPLKGGRGARIPVKEGLWEDRRGRKIDGGERRQAEVRAKRRSAENNAR